MAELRISLLGPFSICCNSVAVSPDAWRNPWALKLLQLLLVMGLNVVSAEEAVRLVGGGMRLADLAPACEQIRAVLEPDATVHTDEQGQVRLQPGTGCWIDLDALVVHYNAGISSAARGEMFPATMALQRAATLYHGDLLAEVRELWVTGPRQRFSEIYADILGRLADTHAVLGRYQDAIAFCHKAIAHLPLMEVAYQRLMVYSYYLGEFTGAAKAYRACREALEGAGRTVSAETDSLWCSLTRSGPFTGPANSVAVAMEDSRKSDG